MLDIEDHLQRVQDGANSVYELSNLSTWISKNTKLEGKPYPYKDHEYQRDVIDNPSKTLYVSKCAQSGLSEIFARWGMAACATQENFTLIWTFPTTKDAEKFCKARLDPFLDESEEFKRVLSRDVNSTELKKFGKNSFCYIRGTVSETGALSVPADLLIHDEFDRSDMANIAAYISRLQHKPTKMRRVFSTPTVQKYGIDLASETAKRFKQVWKCSHCNHHFFPDYENNIVVPGWNRPKKEINKANLKDIRWGEALLLCPKCGKQPSTDLQYREWVRENPLDNFEATHIHIPPFCLPNVLSPAYLVKVSTDFDKWSEFVNQALGLVSDDNDETITEADVRKAIIDANFDSSDLHVMGVDMGQTCWITIAKEVVSSPTNTLVVVHREKVPLSNFIAKRLELAIKYRVIVSVHDAFPYTDTIQKITEFDPNAYGAVYQESLTTVSHVIRDQEEEVEEGKINLRRAMINRSVVLDEIMYALKRGEIIFKKQEDFEELVSHLRDMKRIQKYDKFGGIVYRWEKTQGIDHWHHSLLYAYIAAKLRGTFSAIDNVQTPLVATMRVKANGLTQSPWGTRIA